MQAGRRAVAASSSTLPVRRPSSVAPLWIVRLTRLASLQVQVHESSSLVQGARRRWCLPCLLVCLSETEGRGRLLLQWDDAALYTIILR